MKRVVSRGDLRKFIELEPRVYAGNPHWVPLMVGDVTRLLTNRSPFSPHLSQQAFFVEDGGEAIARVCGFVNELYLDYQGKNCGFFGLFEAMPGAGLAVQELLAAVSDWLKEQGMDEAVGPINGDIFYGFALQTDRFDRMPVFPYGSAQPYYPRYLADAGFQAAYPELAYVINLESVDAELLETVANVPGVTIRPLSTQNFQRDHDLIVTIAHEAFREKWYYASYDLTTSIKYWNAAKSLLMPDLQAIAECEGETAGYLLSFPDYNPAIRASGGRTDPLALIRFLLARRSIRAGAAFSTGVLPGYASRGIGRAMLATSLLAMKKRGYSECYCHTVTKDNAPSRCMVEALGGRVIRRYTGFRKQF